MKSFSRMLLAFGLSVILVQALWGQSLSISLTATDGVATANLTIGNDATGTYGRDAVWGETELPPRPKDGIFDCRLVGLPAYDTLGFGVGRLIDIRHRNYATQSDTFSIKFQTSTEGGNTLHLSWPAGLALVSGGTWRLVSPLDGSVLNIDMTTATSADLGNDTLGALGTDPGPGVYIISGDNKLYTTVSYDSVSFSKDNTPDPAKGFGKPIKPVKNKITFPNVHNLGTALDKNADQKLAKFYFDMGVPLMDASHDSTGAPGKRKAIIHNNYVHIGKYGDIYAGAVSKLGVQHQRDSIFCLDVFHTAAPGKANKKITGKLGTFKPVKGSQNNFYFAQLMMLKYNILLSKRGITPTGLGALVINTPAGGLLTQAFNGDSLGFFAHHCDSTFSCWDTVAGRVSSTTRKEECDLMEAVNNAFQKLGGRLDTVAGPVYGLSKVDNYLNPGEVSISSVSFLHRAGASAAPVNTKQSLMEAGNEPNVYRLDQNYPNPFNPSTKIQFNLVNDGMVTVKVFNLLGQEVASLVNNEQFAAGQQEVTFDASSVASGVYFYRIVVNDIQSGKVVFQDIKKMMLVK